MNISFFEYSHNGVIGLLLDKLKIKYTSVYINHYFDENPYSNTLYGVSILLSDFNVSSESILIEDESDLCNIRYPFVTLYKNELTLVCSESKGVLKICNDGKYRDISFSEFAEDWDNIALIILATNDSEEPDYVNHLKIELKSKSLYLLIMIFSGFLLLRIKSINIGLLLLFILNFIGVIVSYISVLKEENVHNKLSDQLCSLFKANGCNNIIKSEASKLFGIFSWSKLGLSYFFSNMFIIVFMIELIPYVVNLSFLVVLYSIWSIGYQFYMRSWCPFCIITVLVLILSVCVNFYFGLYVVDAIIVRYIFLGLIYLIFFVLIDKCLKLLLDSFFIKEYKRKYNYVVFDDDVFKLLLYKQTFYKGYKDSSTILLGNKESDNYLTIVTNPYCKSCGKIMRIVNRLLNKYNNSICIQLFYMPFNDQQVAMCKFFIYLYYFESDSMYKIISEWFSYGIRNEFEFCRKYPFFCNDKLINDDLIDTEYDKQFLWLIENDINQTPLFIIDGYKFPNNYNWNELIYLELFPDN